MTTATAPRFYAIHRPLGLSIGAHLPRTAPPPASTPARHRAPTLGWTPATAARARAAFQSTDPHRLTRPTALTLTLNAAPARPEHFTALRRATLTTLRRQGMTAHAYALEYTAAGVPHLHLLTTWSRRPDPAAIRAAWAHHAARYGLTAAPERQHVTHAYDPSGWLNYMSKHAGRDAAHYAAHRARLPAHWGHSPRMWASTLTTLPARFRWLTADAFHALRAHIDTKHRARPRFHDARDDLMGRSTWSRGDTERAAAGSPPP